VLLWASVQPRRQYRPLTTLQISSIQEDGACSEQIFCICDMGAALARELTAAIISASGGKGAVDPLAATPSDYPGHVVFPKSLLRQSSTLQGVWLLLVVCLACFPALHCM